MVDWTRRTIQKRQQFLELLSESGNVRASCAALNLCRSTLYQWRASDSAFAAAWDSALELGADGLEDEARRRAMAGSDILLMFLLKALRPEKYRERSQVHIHNNVTSDLRRLPRHELIRRLEAL